MIAIPNMDKPKNCAECFYGLRCKAVPRWVTADDSIPKSCPLIEVDLERDIPTVWYNRQTGQYEPKGTKQEVYERLYKLKNGERRE